MAARDFEDLLQVSICYAFVSFSSLILHTVRHTSIRGPFAISTQWDCTDPSIWASNLACACQASHPHRHVTQVSWNVHKAARQDPSAISLGNLRGLSHRRAPTGRDCTKTKNGHVGSQRKEKSSREWTQKEDPQPPNIQASCTRRLLKYNPSVWNNR